MGLSVWVDEAAGSVCADEEGATPPVTRVICLATPSIVFLFSLTLYEIFMILGGAGLSVNLLTLHGRGVYQI